MSDSQEPVTDPMPETIEGLWQVLLKITGTPIGLEGVIRTAFLAGACGVTQLVVQNLRYRPIGPALAAIRKLSQEANRIQAEMAGGPTEPPAPDQGG